MATDYTDIQGPYQTPGSAMANTLQQILTQQRLDKRQDMMDKLNALNIQSEMQARQQDAQIRQQQMESEVENRKAEAESRLDNMIRNRVILQGGGSQLSPDDAANMDPQELARGVATGFYHKTANPQATVGAQTGAPSGLQVGIGPSTMSTNVPSADPQAGMQTLAPGPTGLPTYSYSLSSTPESRKASEEAKNQKDLLDFINSKPDFSDPANILKMLSMTHGDASVLDRLIPQQKPPDEPASFYDEASGKVNTPIDPATGKPFPKGSVTLIPRPPQQPTGAKDPNDVLEHNAIKGPDGRIYDVVASKNTLINTPRGQIFGPNITDSPTKGIRIFDPDTVASTGKDVTQPKATATSLGVPQAAWTAWEKPGGKTPDQIATNKDAAAQAILTQYDWGKMATTPQEKTNAGAVQDTAHSLYLYIKQKKAVDPNYNPDIDKLLDQAKDGQTKQPRSFTPAERLRIKNLVGTLAGVSS